MWRNGLILWMGLTATAASGTDASDEFGAKRFPFAPTIIENHRPELCNQLLDAALKSFRSSEFSPSLTKEELPFVTWIHWEESRRLETSSGSVFRVDVDLDGTGTLQSILYKVFPHSWRGDSHYAYIVPESAHLDELAKSDKGLSELLSKPDGTFQPAISSDSLHPFFPTAQLVDGVEQSVGTVWSELQLFRWRDRIYLLNQSSWSQRLPPMPITVYRVPAQARLERVCVLDIPNREEAVTAALQSSGLTALLHQLKMVGGNGSGSCGTLNSEGRHFGAAMAASRNTIVRPWAVSRYNPSNDWYGKYFVYDERLRAFLEDWSLGSAWNRIVFLELQQHISHAVQSYAQTLRREFGLSQETATARAQTVIENLVAAWIQVPNSYAPGLDLYSVKQSKITLALLARNAVALNDALKDHEELHVEAPTYPYPQRSPPVSVVSWHMHDAVIWAKGLDAILLAGADVDARNGYGKTPLMTAAHLNRPDAIRRLLRDEADVNARTDAASWGCGYRIERGERTALMYAAENAGLEVIGLLLRCRSRSNGEGLERKRLWSFTWHVTHGSPKCRASKVSSSLQESQNRPIPQVSLVVDVLAT